MSKNSCLCCGGSVVGLDVLCYVCLRSGRAFGPNDPETMRVNGQPVSDVATVHVCPRGEWSVFMVADGDEYIIGG